MSLRASAQTLLPWRRSRKPRPIGPPKVAGSLVRLSLALAFGYAALAGGLMYWQVIEAQRLTNDPLNPLVLSAARLAPRGAIFDRNGVLLARNVDTGGEPLREYLYPAAAPILGYRSTFFGTAGLERTYDAQLTGLISLRPGDELLRKFHDQPYNPSDLRLSLDIELQRFAADLLGDQRGAIVAIEPSTGRVLAIVSSPTFNPNRIVDPDTGRRYVATLRERDDSPLLNRATQGLYVPGSVFKIVTATAGIGSGAITGSTIFPTQPDEYETGFLVQGFRIRDFPRRFQTDHPLDFFEATEVSSNIWYAHAGLQMGPAALNDFAARLGFGARIPFELPTSPSQVTGGGGPLAGFQDQVELANAAYGQAEVLVTPLQMALVAATVGNDGLLMRPKLVDELRSSDGSVTQLGPSAWSQVLAPFDAAIVGQAMQQAVEGPFGELLAGAAKVPGVPTAGKSGTAQLGGDAPPHSWFIGYAPADAPTIAVAVIVEGGGAGAQRAVPMGGDLMSFFLAASE
ncbi:MAG: penicillin-binding transpeptidase domain-containing protein [Candidatus Limnocylindrales bacterium]